MKRLVIYCLFLLPIISCNQSKIFDCDSIDSEGEIYRVSKTQIPATGTMICYYDNGKKMVEENFLNGLLHGKHIEWDSSGNIKFEENLKYGLYDGKQTVYYETGKIMSVRFYKLNREDSTDSEFYPNGVLKVQGHYQYNDSDLNLIPQYQTDSAFVMDSDNNIIGIKKMSSTYYKPKNGLWQYWDEKGILIKQEFYKDGQLLK